MYRLLTGHCSSQSILKTFPHSATPGTDSRTDGRANKRTPLNIRFRTPQLVCWYFSKDLLMLDLNSDVVIIAVVNDSNVRSGESIKEQG